MHIDTYKMSSSYTCSAPSIFIKVPKFVDIIDCCTNDAFTQRNILGIISLCIIVHIVHNDLYAVFGAAFRRTSYRA